MKNLVDKNIMPTFAPRLYMPSPIKAFFVAVFFISAILSDSIDCRFSSDSCYKALLDLAKYRERQFFYLYNISSSKMPSPTINANRLRNNSTPESREAYESGKMRTYNKGTREMNGANSAQTTGKPAEVKLTPSLLSKFAKFLESEKNRTSIKEEPQGGLCIHVYGAGDNMYAIMLIEFLAQFLDEELAKRYLFAELRLKSNIDALRIVHKEDMRALRGVTIKIA